MRAINVVIVGAMGLVGQEIGKVILEHQNGLPIGAVRLLATERSAGRRVAFGDRVLEVEEIAEEAFRGADFAFFATPNDVSERWAPIAAEAGAIVIDKSSRFRMDEGIPLVVPEVNIGAVGADDRIIASPNCSTIQLVMALWPLERAVGIRALHVDTYQSVSGSGREAMTGLTEEVREWKQGEEGAARAYTQPVAFNVLAQCDSFLPDGSTREEQKLRLETRKILARQDLPISATAVRVPVLVGHAEAVRVELSETVDVAKAHELLAAQPGVRVVDDPTKGIYPTPRMAAGQDDVLVGRVRRDLDYPNVLHLFIVADNLRKGAATNAVQIAEALWRNRA